MGKEITVALGNGLLPGKYTIAGNTAAKYHTLGVASRETRVSTEGFNSLSVIRLVCMNTNNTQRQQRLVYKQTLRLGRGSLQNRTHDNIASTKIRQINKE